MAKKKVRCDGDRFDFLKALRLSRRDVNKAGISSFFGFVGILTANFILGVQSYYSSVILISIFVAYGYFVVGTILFGD